MVRNRVRLGGVVFEIESPWPMELGGRLPLFVTEDEPNHIVTVCREDQVSDYAQVRRSGDRIQVALGRQWLLEPTVWNILSTLPLPELLLEKGTLTLHASYIIHQGQGILFSGPSGIGKSTQAELWRQCRGARIINGDRVLVTPGEGMTLADSHFHCGTSGICVNETAPLKAIVLLEQGQENRVSAASPLEAFRLLMAQLNYNVKDDRQMIQVTALVERLMAHVPVVRYSCRKDETAVTDLEKYLYEESSNKDYSQR